MAHFQAGNLASAYTDRYQALDNDHAHTSVNTRPPPPPITRKPLPGQQQTISRRERDNFIHRMQSEKVGEEPRGSDVFNNHGVPRIIYGVTRAPAGDRDELHFWSPEPAPARSESEATAAAIEQLLRTAQVALAVLEAPNPTFIDGTRHLTAASQQALAAQLGDIKSLRKQLAGYLDGLDLDPRLKDAMQARGLQVADAEQQLDGLMDRCNERSDAIAALRAHDMVEVPDHPDARRLAQQMMESEQTRAMLGNYIKDTAPLELQVTRNELAKLRSQLTQVITDKERNDMEQQALMRDIDSLQASLASPNQAWTQPDGSTIQAGSEMQGQLLAKHRDLTLAQKQGKHQWETRRHLTERVDALSGQIAELEGRVDPVGIPVDENATEMTTDAVACYLSRKYEPIRPHLHALRDELDRLLPEDGVVTAERKQLVKLRKQIEQTLEAADKAEYGYIARTLEQAYTDGVDPRIAYSTQATKSLSTRMAHYASHGAVRREPTELTKARSHYDECKKMYRQAYEQQRAAKKNLIEHGTPIDNNLLNRTEELKKRMAQAEAPYLALQAIEDKELPMLQRTARRNLELKQLSERTLYAMLDERLTFFQQQGYTSLAEVPPPKPAVDDMGYLAQRYHVRLSELEQDPERNRQPIATLKNKIAFLAPKAG